MGNKRNIIYERGNKWKINDHHVMTQRKRSSDFVAKRPLIRKRKSNHTYNLGKKPTIMPATQFSPRIATSPFRVVIYVHSPCQLRD